MTFRTSQNYDPKAQKWKVPPSQPTVNFFYTVKILLHHLPFLPPPSKGPLKSPNMSNGSIPVLFHCPSLFLCEAFHDVRLLVEIVVECHRCVDLALVLAADKSQNLDYVERLNSHTLRKLSWKYWGVKICPTCFTFGRCDLVVSLNCDLLSISIRIK